VTTIHPRRTLAEAEAAAWLEEHADWCRGLPAEVRDTSVIGTETVAHADGRSLAWYRMDGARIGAPAPRTEASVDRSPRGRHSHPLQGWGESVHTDSLLPMPEAGAPWPLRGRALRAVAQQDTEQLRPTTVALGDRVPAAMQYDRRADANSRRQGVTQAFADLSGHADTSWQEELAAAELLAWLRLEAGLTERELEALQCRAARVAQADRSGATLARAQRRARAALLAH
jgi:hypothetical protein